MWGTIISAAAPIIGGLLSNKQSADNKAEDVALQREFAQNGIRWKVADAKAAGLHPLHALGASTASYTPSISVTDGLGNAMSEAGQGLGRAINAQQTQSERSLQQAQLAHLEAQTRKEDAMSAYYASEASRTAQASRQTAAMPEAVTSASIQTRPLSSLPNYADAVNIEPNKIVSRNSQKPATAAGNNPFFSEFQLRDEKNRQPVMIELPYTEEGPGEAMENISWWQWPAIVAHNMKRYGPNWLHGGVLRGNKHTWQGKIKYNN